MKYTVNRNTWSYRRPGFPTWAMDRIQEGFTFDDIASVSGWICCARNRWIQARYCDVAIGDALPPLPPAEVSVRLMKTIRGDEKPYGFRPEGLNKNSFDIVLWLLTTTKISKPPTIRISPGVIQSILALNDYQNQAVKWLVSQRGTDKILSVNDRGIYTLPVPCGSGNNLVNVLEVRGRFARIETVNVNRPIPEMLPPWLLHTWYAWTKGGVYYKHLGDIGGVKYPLLNHSDSAWVDLRALK